MCLMSLGNIRLVIISCLFLTGCAGIKSFPNSAKSGETVAVAAGWKHNFSRENITVTIIPSVGDSVVYMPGNAAVRAVVNLYPDPLSSILISPEIQSDITPFAQTYADQLKFNFTNGDKDWWQTSVFIDLPMDISPGPAVIEIVSDSGEFQSAEIEILDGFGLPDDLSVELNGPLYPDQLRSMERVGHYVLSMSAATIPYAIELQLSHDPDVDNGGTGKAYVVNPRGDLKNIHWNDDGSSMKLMLIPAQAAALSSMQDFKVYIAGGVNGLFVDEVKGYDLNGNQISGVTASITYH